MANKKLKYIIGRVICYFVYFSVGYLLSLGAMNDSTGSAGPICFFFSWGSLPIFLLRYMDFLHRYLKGILDSQFGYIIDLLGIAFLTGGYLISLVILNGKQAKKDLRFPLLSVVYHFLGVFISYFFRFKFEEVWGLRFFLIFYTVVSGLAVLYIYFDWHLARKLVLLRKGNP